MGAPECAPECCAADEMPAAGSCPGWWGGGSGDPTACCIRCHSVSYLLALAAEHLPRSLPNGTAPGRRLVNGRGGSEVPMDTRQIG
ncbi:hypothetical protein GCM10010307_12970 [Streptomyces vastus]|uniref:Uncharacterized protein n=1 Tax=Streptomyces vastus TaxID=285451 RepID=A0ABN3QGC0_9ACTN